jgi:Ca2+-dependent lipid-binding protein
MAAKVYPSTDVDVIHLDLDLNYSPTDTELIKKKNNSIRNSQIILTTRVGKGIVGVDIPILLKEICIVAKLRLQM